MITHIFSYFFKTLCSIPRTVYAMVCMARICRPRVTVFGGKRVKNTSPEYHKAYSAGSLLAAEGFGVLTGGGAGIMEAALCGAIENDGQRGGLGIGVVGVDEGFVATCRPAMVDVSNFEIRKRLLTYYSHAFIIFPGGIGTLDEFAEIINLMKVNKLKPVPIVLIGKDYWHHIVVWFEVAIQHDLLLPSFKKYVMITDDIDAGLSFIRSFYFARNPHAF